MMNHVEDLGPVTSFKDFIRRRRKHLGLTQLDIARAVGVQSPDYISLVEQGYRRLDLDRIPRLAEVLKVNVAVLSRFALEEQFPVLAKCLVRGKLPAQKETVTEIDIAADKLRDLPRDLRHTALSLIDNLHDRYTIGVKAGDKYTSVA